MAWTSLPAKAGAANEKLSDHRSESKASQLFLFYVYISRVKLFSKQRKQLIPGSNFSKYVVYAIGEIILVVIGILIAVSINNWNEDKKDRSQLTTYLTDYRNDLQVDSVVISQNLRLLEFKKAAFDLVLSDTLTRTNLMQNPTTFALMLTYNPIQFQTKGYNELNTYVANSETRGDTLVQRIIAEHAAYQILLDTSFEKISEDISDNMYYLKNNKPWLSDLFKNNVTDEVIEYFLSRDYRNRVSVHQVLVYANMKAFLEAYKSYIDRTLQSLNERLDVVE